VNKIRERADKAPPDPLAISDEDKPQRNEAGRFATGRQKTGGRQRGTPNKLPKSIKEVIRMLCDGVLLVDGKVIAHEVAEQLMAGLQAGPPHARGYLELLLNYGVGKPVAQTSGNGGGRFEIILPNARNMRDPLLPPGAPALPMRILGQDPDKALPAASKDRQSGNQGGRRDIAGGRSGAATSPASSTRASKSGPAPQGVLAKAVQAARGVPAAKIPPPADDQDSPEALKAQLMEVIEEREICPMCNGAKVVRTGHFGEVEKCANCEGTGWLQ
jgi:hypothetical protein